jgi:hypothetical protein
MDERTEMFIVSAAAVSYTITIINDNHLSSPDQLL